MHRLVFASAVLVAVLLGAPPAGAADSDHDGVGNRRDRCPTVRAAQPDGCPLGRWSLASSNHHQTDFEFLRFGSVATQPIAGDWNGDGKDTVGVYDPSNERWRFRGGATFTTDFGDSPGLNGGDMVRLTGDWNGDGKDTVGVYDPSTGTFALRNSNTAGGADVVFAFGGVQPARHVVPVVGDWDGDSVDTVGIVRRDTNRWRLRDSNAAGPADHDFFWGDDNGDIPFAIDVDGDGQDTVGRTFRAGGRQRYQALPDLDANGDVLSWSLGDPNDGSRGPIAAFVGDWDGDGIDTGGLRSS
jgi:hypothetical protein